MRLATFDLHGPASGALVGQTAPTESTGAYAALSALAVCRDYAHEQQQRAESAEAGAEELFDAALAIYETYGPPSDYDGEARALWERLGAALYTRDSFTEPVIACAVPSGDGRTCRKPRGHDGLHWTYGKDTLSWAAAVPSWTERED